MTRRNRLEKGIRPWKGDLRGYIRVRGILYSKTYNLDEPLDNLRTRAKPLATLTRSEGNRSTRRACHHCVGGA